MSSQFAPGTGEMPPDRDGRDAEEGCDRRHGESLEFVHHQDRPSPGWEGVERLPHRDLQQVQALWVRGGRRSEVSRVT